MSDNIRVLIIDDEPLARRGIKSLLKRHGDIEVVGESDNGIRAAEEITTKSPDLVFLDVQMPGLNGFEVIKKVGILNMPVTIFITAYDVHALHAFEVHAIDYLLKPINSQRFDNALQRARTMVESRTLKDIRRKLQELLARRQPANQYLQRFFIKHKERVVIVPAEHVDWIEAQDDYVCVHAEEKKHLLRQRIGAVEEQLDPALFVRIHRSFIVPIKNIKGLKPMFNGDQLVILHDDTELPMSRTYSKKIISLLQHIF